MNENINEVTKENDDVENVEVNDVVLQDNTKTFEDTLVNGSHSLLYKRINEISINDIRIRDAFAKFINDVECGSSFSVAEIINSAESIVKDGEPDENADNDIYYFDYFTTSDKKLNKKLLKNSVGGLYSLFAIHNGIYLDLQSVNGDISAIENKRFLVINPKKSGKLIKKANAQGLQLVNIGRIMINNKIVIANGASVIEEVDKSLIDNSAAPVSLTLSSEHFPAFLSGFRAVCSLVLCNCVSYNNLIRFGLNTSLASACACALGYYAASVYLKMCPLRTVYTDDKNTVTAVARPNVSDGEYVYLLRLRNTEYGMPDKAHLSQLYLYLTEKRRMGVIKNVLPVRENIETVINRLGGDKLEYITLTNFPDDSFGIIVSVDRGDSVNGIKLGYFKNIDSEIKDI